MLRQPIYNDMYKSPKPKKKKKQRNERTQKRYSLPRKRVVEKQPQSASKNVQFLHPLLLPPPLEIHSFGRRLIIVRQKQPPAKENRPNLLQTLIKHIQHGLCPHHPHSQTTAKLLVLLLIIIIIIGIGIIRLDLGAPEGLGEVEESAIVRGEHGRVEAAGESGGNDAELLSEAAELLGELGFGVRLRHGIGELVEEEVEVFGEGETLGIAVEEALEESDFVGLGPYSVEFEWRRFGGGSCCNCGGGGAFVVEWGFEFGGEEIRVRVRGRGVRVVVVGGFAFDGEFARRGFGGERRGRLRGRWC